MPKNARDQLAQWWGEQYRIARVPSAGIVKEYASAEDAIAASRRRPDFERSATPDVAEGRMAVISQLRNFVNSDAVLSDMLERHTPGDPLTLPNNQLQAVWTDICAIAAISDDTQAAVKSWAISDLRSLRVQQLAATINTCRG